MISFVLSVDISETKRVGSKSGRVTDGRYVILYTVRNSHIENDT